MGYQTDFNGELLFKHEPSVAQIRKLAMFFGQDAREHPEWEAPKNLDYIDLELNDAMTGIKWSGTEKTYHLEDQVNFILRAMRKEWPDFGLTGKLMAQGEEMEDRWMLVMEGDGNAYKRKIAITGQRVKCPDCGHKFILEDAQG